MALYALVAGTTDLWDRDEPRYARTAVEVWAGGDWLVPHLNDEPRLRKPPLIYWMMAPFVGLLGPTTLASRLVSVLGMTAAAVLTYWCGRRMFDARTGRRAMVIFGTAGLTVYMGAASMIDAAMIAFTTAGIYAFIDAVYRRPLWWHWPVILASFAGAALLKGPLVWPIPLLAMVGAAVLARREIRLRAGWWVGMAVCAAAGLGSLVAWAVPADEATGGALYDIGFRKHVVQRLTTGLEGHGSGNALEYVLMLPLYVPYLIAMLFPWTLHLPGGVRALISRTLGGRRERAILLAATVPWLVLISLASTKLPHYLLPIFPFLAIWAAAGLSLRERDGMTADDRAWLRGGVWFFGPVALLMIAGVLALPLFLERYTLMPLAIISATALGAVAVPAIVLQLHERIGVTTRLMAIASPALIAVATLTLLPAVEDGLKASRDVARAVHAAIEPTDPLYMIDYDEPSLFFYINRPVGYPIVRLEMHEVADWAHGRGAFAAGPRSERGPDTEASVSPHDRRDPGGVLILGRSMLDRIEAEHGRLPIDRLWSKTVIDYSNTTHHEEVMLVRPAGG